MEPNTIALVGINVAGRDGQRPRWGTGSRPSPFPSRCCSSPNRVLNPALVPIEVVLNAYVLYVNRRSLPGVWRRMLPIVVALAPGIVVGTLLVSMVSSDWLKFINVRHAAAADSSAGAGFRRPIKSSPERQTRRFALT